MPLDPMPDWVHSRRRVIGLRIRAARHAAHLSQVHLGESTGLDHKTIHRIEYAISDPTLSDLLLLAQALDVPLTDLIAEPQE